MDRNIPDWVVQLIYGRLGFNAVTTEILDYRDSYVLLATPTRLSRPYSIVSLGTRRTVDRFDEPAEAQHMLEQLAAGTYRFRPPEEM